MNNFRKSVYSKLLWLLTLVAITLSLLSSCGFFTTEESEDNKGETEEETVYIASSKDEILANIAESLKTPESEYSMVTKYIEVWGVSAFDKLKFSYFESCFMKVYAYEGGLPEAEAHAKMAVERYLESYYDVIDLSNKDEVTDSLLYCYVDIINDPYSIYRIPVAADEYTEDMSGKFGGIGVVIEYNDREETIQVTTVYPDSPAEAAGIMVGDFITAVNGVSIEEIGYRNAVNHIRGEIGTSVDVTLLRNGESVTVTAIRAEVEVRNVVYSFDEESKIGYVEIVSFKANTFDQFKKAIDELEAKGAVGFVFDLRGNPGGYLYSVRDVLSYIVPSDNTVVTYQYKNQALTTLKTQPDGYLSGNGESAIPYDHVISVPIIVLCDEYTASAGEIFTSALRDYADEGIANVTIVGTTTYGKGIMQNTYTYSDGSSVTLTVAYYNPPCGVNYHGVGITPDVYVELPAAELDPETGKFLPVEDTQLKAGIEELKKLLVAN